MIYLTTKKTYKNKQKGKEVDIADIKYDLSLQLPYEQYYAGIWGRLPLFENKNNQTLITFRVKFRYNCKLTKCGLQYLRYFLLTMMLRFCTELGICFLVCVLVFVFIVYVCVLLRKRKHESLQTNLYRA